MFKLHQKLHHKLILYKLEATAVSSFMEQRYIIFLQCGRKLHGLTNPIFRFITLAGACKYTDFQREPGSQIHKWLKTILWRLNYRVRCVFMEHIRTHNSHRTYANFYALPEQCCRPGATIHDDNVFGGLLHVSTG